MSSVIKVDEIQTATGGTKVFDTTRVFDMWRVSTDQNPQTKTLTGWERPTGTYHDVFPVPIGPGLSIEEDSIGRLGVFSFGITGYYRIDAMIMFYSIIRNSHFAMDLKVSNDNGSNYTDYVQAFMGNAGSSTGNTTVAESCSMKFFINVKNISGSNATKFKFSTQFDTSSEEIIGFDSNNLGSAQDAHHTYFTCQRLAPPIG